MKREDEYTPEEIVEHARGNHIWLSAFACNSPSEEFAATVGRQVIAMLNHSDMVDSFIGRTKVVYVRLNKS